MALPENFPFSRDQAQKLNFSWPIQTVTLDPGHSPSPGYQTPQTNSYGPGRGPCRMVGASHAVIQMAAGIAGPCKGTISQVSCHGHMVLGPSPPDRGTAPKEGNKNCGWGACPLRALNSSPPPLSPSLSLSLPLSLPPSSRPYFLPLLFLLPSLSFLFSHTMDGT